MEIILKIKKFILKQIKDIQNYGSKELYRKFCLSIKVSIKILMDLFAIIPCLIIRLMKPWLLIRIEQFPVSNFGGLVTFPATYCCKKKFKIDQPSKNYIDLVYIHYDNKLYNRQLTKMWKKNFNFLPAFLLDPIKRVNKIIVDKINKLLKFSFRYFFFKHKKNKKGIVREIKQ